MSAYLIQRGDYAHALEVCHTGAEFSAARKQGRLNPDFEFNKALALRGIGKNDDCLRPLQHAYFGYAILGEPARAKKALMRAKEGFGITFDPYGVDKLGFAQQPGVPYHRGEPVQCKTTGTMIKALRERANLDLGQLSHGICDLTYEQVHNKGTGYWYNELNQQVQKVVDGKDTYVNTFDLRGNLVQSAYQKNQNQSTVTASYTYDATNRMVQGTNKAGETSAYIFNGLGHLVANDMTFANNSYGYHGNSVRKDYVLDYTSHLADAIMEYESGDSGHTYRFTYGLRKSSVVIYGIPSGVGSTAQTFDYPDGTESVVKMWYHHDRLGSTAYLTDNTAGAVSSFVCYDDWGAPTMKSIIRLGSRYLDLATSYTGHPYDPVLGVYYARARMYDAADRRFMAVDWIGSNIVISQSFNRYANVRNNPLVFIDPLGLIPELVSGATISGGKRPIDSVYYDAGEKAVYADFSELIWAWGVTIVGGNNGVYSIASASGAYYANIEIINDQMQSTMYLSRGSVYVHNSLSVSNLYYADTKTRPLTLISFSYFKRLMCQLGYDRAEIKVNVPRTSNLTSGFVSIPASISDRGLEFILAEEGFRSRPYVGKDYANITIGYGNMLRDGVQEYRSFITRSERRAIDTLKERVDAGRSFSNVNLNSDDLMRQIRARLHTEYPDIISSSGLGLSEAEARTLARQRIDDEFSRSVNTFLQSNPQIKITQYQFDALVDFAYNFGPRYFTNTGSQSGDTIREFLIAGDYSQTATMTCFTEYSGGSRRVREAYLFCSGQY